MKEIHSKRNSEKRIVVNSETIQLLRTSHKCSVMCVYNALGYRSNSKLAEEIRRNALNLGGVIYEGMKNHNINTQL